MTYYRKRGYKQRGGAALSELTERLYSAPWSLGKDDLQTLSNLTPEEFVANSDGVSKKNAQTMIEFAQSKLQEPGVPETTDINDSKISAAEARQIAKMEEQVTKKELAGIQKGGYYYNQRGSALTKEQLKQMAINYGIDCNGSKAELCDRVLNALFPEQLSK